MGHSSSVYAISPPSEQDLDATRKMKAVWDACVQAGVPVPEKVTAFFAIHPAEPVAKVTRLYEGSFGTITQALRPYGKVGSGEEGYEVDLDKLPAGTKTIRFVCHW